MNALRVAVAIATVMASSLPVLAASEPPPGAASCSGCHTTGEAAAAPVVWQPPRCRGYTAATPMRS